MDVFCWKCFLGEAFPLETLYACLLLLRNPRNPRTMCSHQLRGTGSPKTDCSSWVGRTCLRRKQIKGKANAKPFFFSGFWETKSFQDSFWGPKKSILGQLRPIFAHLGAILGHLRTILGHLGAILGLSWSRLGLFGAIWSHLGAILETTAF